MKIHQIYIHNYKSIRKVVLDLPRIAVLIGINASGKSNLCDAIDFLSEVYKYGLKVAIARKGGYENICFRRTRRSKGAIEFKIKITLDSEDIYKGIRTRSTFGPLTLFHEFKFQATSQRIDTDFIITEENIEVYKNLTSPKPSSYDKLNKMFSISKTEGKISISSGKLFKREAEENYFVHLVERLSAMKDIDDFFKTELLITLFKQDYQLRGFLDVLSSFRTFQISPRYSREPGVPIPVVCPP